VQKHRAGYHGWAAARGTLRSSRRRVMAKNGFRVMDSDIHVIEPRDCWVRYMEPAFRDQAPRFSPIDGSSFEGWQFAGKVFPAFIDRPERRKLAKVRKDKARVRHLATG